MCDGECQTQASVFVNGAASVFTAHPANWSKTCKISDFTWQFNHFISDGVGSQIFLYFSQYTYTQYLKSTLNVLLFKWVSFITLCNNVFLKFCLSHVAVKLFNDHDNNDLLQCVIYSTVPIKTYQACHRVRSSMSRCPVLWVEWHGHGVGPLCLPESTASGRNCSVCGLRGGWSPNHPVR